MNDHDVITRLSAMPDDDVSVHVDVDTVITSVKVQRRRRRAVAATVLATAALVGGLVVATGQFDRDTATPAAQPGTWTVTSPGIKGASLSAVAAVSHSDVWAVGYLRAPHSTGLATHWDGTRWTRYVLSKGYAPADVAAVASNDVWAVGGKDADGRKSAALHWDGSGWHEIPVPMRGRESDLSSVAAVSADDIWAVGSAQDGSGRPYIVHWDGQTWREMPTPAVPGAKGMVLRDITAIAADDVWAVGVSDAGSGRQPLSMHWDGQRWSVIPITEPAGDISAVAALGPDGVWAATYDKFFHWDGSQWRILPIPAEVEGQYLTLAPDGAGGLLAAGLTRKCQTVSCPRGDDGGRILVARWNGTEWAQIKPPAEGVGQIHKLSATPGTGVIWATGDVLRPSSGVDVTGKPVVEELTQVVASIFFAQ